MNGLPNFEEFLSDLIGCFIEDPEKVAFIKQWLSPILSSLKIQATQQVNRYVSNDLIPELSRLIQSTFGVSAEKQLILLKPFIIRGLETFLQKGRVINKDEIIQVAKRENIPELIIEMAIPMASENTKHLVRNAMDSVQEAVFIPGTTPSVEKLLQMLLKKCADKAFCIDRAELCYAVDKLIELMPETVDKIMEFLKKHVLPALSVCFEATAFALVSVFLKICFERLRKEGKVRFRGRDLAKPMTAMKALNLAKNAVAKDVSTVMTETVVKEKVTHKIVQKCVVDKAGRKMVTETTQKMAAKTSKDVVSKVTQKASSKAVTTASQATQSVKVGTKAVNSISSKTTHQGVQVAEKTVQKASFEITKNVGDHGISNGVTKVTKKVAVRRTVKSTLTETAESVTATTTTKVTKTSVNKTTHISQTSSKAVAEVGMKNAAKAGLTAAGISAVVGGVFLYRDLKDLDKKKKEGSLSAEEYKEQKVERIGEFAGDVIGTGVVGAAVSIAALSGPVGWAAIGAGAIVSFATGKLGGRIAKAFA